MANDSPAPQPGLRVEALGRSDQFLDFQERLSMAAKVERPVILVGERGTGKELAAARLHFLSSRWDGPFIVLNCAAVAPTLVASELFGHEAGAFTGAVARKKGRFELAHTGTLFLDEIAGMPLEAQEMVLRAVEYGEVVRVGGQTPIRVDVRLVCAANQDLPALAEQGKFRRDLLDRLSFEVLTLPPLRAREGDAKYLARHFAMRMALDLGLPEPEFSQEALERLGSHSWPGNVRELKNAVERAVFRSGGGPIADLELDPFASPYRPKSENMDRKAGERVTPSRTKPVEEVQPPDMSTPLPRAVARLETDMLRQALERARYNQKKAAALLGLTYNQFRGLYRKHKAALDSLPGKSGEGKVKRDKGKTGQGASR